jgi:hypothetical protein
MLIADWSVEINVREYGRGNKKKDNPEKLATWGTLIGQCISLSCNYCMIKEKGTVT